MICKQNFHVSILEFSYEPLVVCLQHVLSFDKQCASNACLVLFNWAFRAAISSSVLRSLIDTSEGGE